MGRKRGPRFRRGLPRGGLGQLGWLPSLGSLAAACFLQTELALIVSLSSFPFSVWCALGLRRDDAAGEISDHYVDTESLSWKEMLSGNFEHPVRRQSTGMIAVGVLACGIAWSRWFFGWGPLV